VEKAGRAVSLPQNVGTAEEIATRGMDLAKVTKRGDVWITSAQPEIRWEGGGYKMQWF
jgi:hypothetical protein